MSQAYNFSKRETLAQVFSCGIFKNTFSYRTPLGVAYVVTCNELRSITTKIKQ